MRTRLAKVDPLTRLEPLPAGLAGRRPGPYGGPALALTIGGIGAAVMVGFTIAADVPIGIGVLIALCYLPLVFVNLPMALALWVPLAFLHGIPAFNLGGEAAGLLIAASWFGSLRSRADAVRAIISRHRTLLAALAGLVIWLTLSLGWAEDGGLALADVWHWYAVAVLFLVAATTLPTMETIRLVLLAFVGGAVVAVISGILDGSLTSEVAGGARESGNAGDPNFLAASLVAATVLAGCLFAVGRSLRLRVPLLVAIAVLITGLVWSASRGGALAAGATIIAAFFIFKRQRLAVGAATAVTVGIAALTFANAPTALERVTAFDDDGGRSDLWTVAWRMGADHPIVGVGLNNFVVNSPDYVRRPGEILRADQIVDQTTFVHNTYLQLYAENGLIALALYLLLVGACLAATKRAAERFKARGETASETLARGVLLATISILAAAFFLSAALDQRLWLLLALGPALLAIASRERGSAPTSPGAARGGPAAIADR